MHCLSNDWFDINLFENLKIVNIFDCSFIIGLLRQILGYPTYHILACDMRLCIVIFKAEHEFCSMHIFRFEFNFTAELLHNHLTDDKAQSYTLSVELSFGIFD